MTDDSVQPPEDALDRYEDAKDSAAPAGEPGAAGCAAGVHLKCKGAIHILCGLSIFVIGFLVHVLPEIRSDKAPTLSVDEKTYVRLSESILEGKGFDLSMSEKGHLSIVPWMRKDGPSTFSPPLQPLQLAMLTKAGFSLRNIVAFNSLLVVISAIFVYILCLRVTSTFLALIAGLLMLANMPLLSYGHRLLTEAPWIFLMTTTAWLASRQWRWRYIPAIGTGLGCGLMILTRGEGPLLLPFFLLGLCHDLKRFWKDPFVITALVTSLLVVTPWVVRNYVHTQEFVLSRSGAGFNLWIGSNPNTIDIDSLANGWTYNCRPWPAPVNNADLNEVEIDRAVQKASMRFALSHPHVWFLTSIRRLLYLWQPLNWNFAQNSLVVRLTLSALMLLGLFAAPYGKKETYLLLAPFLVYSFVGGCLLGGNMLHRFRAMASPSESMLIACGIGLVWQLVTGRLLRKRGRRTVPLIGLSVLLLVCACAGLHWVRLNFADRTAFANVTFAPGETYPFQTTDEIGKGTRITERDGKHVLILDASTGEKGNLKGIEINIPEQYTLAWEYKLRIRAKEMRGDKVSVVINAPQDHIPEENVPGRQTLAQITYSSGLSGEQWNEKVVFFQTPYRGRRPISASIHLSDPNNQHGYLVIDSVSIEKAAIGERMFYEYFTKQTSRRRGSRYFK